MTTNKLLRWIEEFEIARLEETEGVTVEACTFETPASPTWDQSDGMLVDESDNEYVLADIGSGNCVLFWRKDCKGYTCDLDDAHVFTKAEAFEQHGHRPKEDQPIPLAVAQRLAVTHVRREPICRWLAAQDSTE